MVYTEIGTILKILSYVLAIDERLCVNLRIFRPLYGVPENCFVFGVFFSWKVLSVRMLLVLRYSELHTEVQLVVFAEWQKIAELRIL